MHQRLQAIEELHMSTGSRSTWTRRVDSGKNIAFPAPGGEHHPTDVIEANLRGLGATEPFDAPAEVASLILNAVALVARGRGSLPVITALKERRLASAYRTRRRTTTDLKLVSRPSRYGHRPCRYGHVPSRYGHGPCRRSQLHRTRQLQWARQVQRACQVRRARRARWACRVPYFSAPGQDAPCARR